MVLPYKYILALACLNTAQSLTTFNCSYHVLALLHVLFPPTHIFPCLISFFGNLEPDTVLQFSLRKERGAVSCIIFSKEGAQKGEKNRRFQRGLAEIYCLPGLI